MPHQALEDLHNVQSLTRQRFFVSDKLHYVKLLNIYSSSFAIEELQIIGTLATILILI